MQSMAGNKLLTVAALHVGGHGAEGPTHVPNTDDAQPLNAVRLGNCETPGQSCTKVMPNHLAPTPALQSHMLPSHIHFQPLLSLPKTPSTSVMMPADALVYVLILYV